MEKVSTNEKWAKITNFPIYEVSNRGRVRNGSSGYVLKPCTDGKGFLYVGLCKNGKSKIQKVHKLVGQEFIQNPDNKPLVGHIDAMARKNNNIDNLRWHTHSEHQRHIKMSRVSNQDVSPSGSGSSSGSLTK